MAKLKPFEDDAASVSIGELTVENGTDRVALYGSLDLTRDKRGLAQALVLKALIDEVVHRLQAAKDLPDAVPEAAPSRSVPNPFT